MEKYNHKKIEKKWQEKWEKDELYKTSEDADKPKSYVLDMFPYPSGEGLHVGHPKGYIATDIYSRYKKMKGFNILHPMGWDAFGLPAENYAIKNKIHPKIAVDKNIKRFKEQLLKIGFNYDWGREINTTDPEYYKWTQWIFLQMFKKGLAYESYEPINWCPSCKTGLANEDLDGDKCERCGTVVEKKPMRQWVLKITDYAERLLEGLDDLDWPNSIKESQKNWIGKSEGAEIEFAIAPQGRTSSVTNSSSRNDLFPQSIKVFTTRPDTLFGSTYMVLAPEHKLVQELKSEITNFDEVEKYINDTNKKTEIERTAEGKEKTGVELKGVKAINPANKEEVSVFVADYVVVHYGTGAIMAVPAHDERDHEFAKKFDLPISDADLVDIDEVVERVNGKKTVNYKLQDWVFSRQRYWGEPIPIIHCDKCGVVPVPEEDLPVVLPEVESYEPTGTVESPLADIEEWINVKCPKCKGDARRESNTMPQWAGSSWYYLRYIDPKNSEVLVDKEKEKYWSPVDMYVGGAEHATRHLIYARFWHKFLYDIGVVNYEEPFTKLQHVGLINAEDGRKMSKRFGNVVNPDEIIETFGADSLRLYEMFMGPFDQAIAWSTDNIVGVRRFIEKVWRLQEKVDDAEEGLSSGSEADGGETLGSIITLLHKTIKKVGEDIEDMKFNTAISTMMILANELEKEEKVSKEIFSTLLILLAPFAPHVAEELWDKIEGGASVLNEGWPKYDEAKIVEDTAKIGIQIDGKVRTTIEVSVDEEEEKVKEKALSNEVVQKWTEGKEVKKVMYIKGKIVSIVTN
jgi:leucyl-tRNA synthetase